MRRSAFLCILSLVLLAGGIFSVACDAKMTLTRLDAIAWMPLLGAGVLATSAGAALFAFISHAIATQHLRRQLTELTASGRLRKLDVVHPDVAKLTHAINDVIDHAAQVVQRASVQVKELEIQLKIATAERQHAQAIIYSISDAVLVTDPFDEIVLANESAARTFSFDLKKARRAPIDNVLSDQKVIELIREMRRSETRSGQRIVDHQIHTSAGDRAYKITLACVADQQDGPVGVVTVLHDMTREREVADMKNDFVSNVSHELRTPLASIKAYVEMLIDGEADDEKTTREFYEVIQNEANRLSRLIDNILNISRIESGLVKINKQPQSLVVIVKEAIEVILPQAKMKQITVQEELLPAVYQTMADKDMLYQATLNLLSNAVKYTPENGTITVRTLVDEARKRVIIRISDTGVGIPPKDLPFVFDKFYRVEQNNRMAKGTGLGLPLVKHIIETVHRGAILAESESGKGSTFGFELDLCE